MLTDGLEIHAQQWADMVNMAPTESLSDPEGGDLTNERGVDPCEGHRKRSLRRAIQRSAVVAYRQQGIQNPSRGVVSESHHLLHLGRDVFNVLEPNLVTLGMLTHDVHGLAGNLRERLQLRLNTECFRLDRCTMGDLHRNPLDWKACEENQNDPVGSRSKVPDERAQKLSGI